MMKYQQKFSNTKLVTRDVHPELPIDPDAMQPGVYKWPPHFTPAFLLIVFVGGYLGAAARYWVNLRLPTPQEGWPVGTFFINLLGALLLGLLLEGLTRLGDDTGSRRVARLAVGTGFMGAFTTYSTLAVETDLLLRHGHMALAGGYIAASVMGGVICSGIGIQIAAVHHRRGESK